ncbi:LysR family transcriptional regulator [Pseudomonas sichuanensis]|uniref:LysR family transcriptional regulator n=1 Tax=Pseudomonas sichuanensis TaxID=2213015 RepID=UPI0036ED1E46
MKQVKNIDLALLRAFAEVASCGSMTTAASRLHLTQGGVSQRIKRLEDLLGCQLLNRDAHGCHLTEIGKTLLPDASHLLRLNDLFCSEASGLQKAEIVRLGLPFDMAGNQLAPLLKVFSESFPLSEIRIHCASSLDIAKAFICGKVDLALIQSPIASAEGELLTVDQLIWLGSSSSAKIRPLPVCLLTPNCVFRDSISQRLSTAGVEWKVVFENESVDTTLSLVLNELAVTPWLLRLVPEQLQHLVLKSELPTLPEHAISMQVDPNAGAAVLGLAETIRLHFREGKTQ